MRQYDVKCPLCGTVNRGLYLEETDHWMECGKCKSTVRMLDFATLRKVPIFTAKQLVTLRRAAP